MVAEQIGAFKAAGLDVKIVPPSDPALPPRLVAAKQADLAITYQPQLHFFADQGLPLMRVGSLINTPLNTVIALDKNITSPADLKGKTVGYSVSGIEQATLATMVEHEHLKPQDIKLINVNFQLTSALLAGQVDAVIGGYRNIEALELKLQGKTPVVFNVEDFGVPAYDELIIVAHRDAVNEPKIRKFLAALKQGSDYLHAHPQDTWLAFAKAHPELNTELNKQAASQPAAVRARSGQAGSGTLPGLRTVPVRQQADQENHPGGTVHGGAGLITPRRPAVPPSPRPGRCAARPPSPTRWLCSAR